MTVVSFLIADDDVTIRKKEGSYSSHPIGILPLRPGKRLCVIAGWEPEGNLKTRVQEALSKIDAQQFMTEHTVERTLSMCLTGESSPDSVYMVVVPVSYSGGPTTIPSDQPFVSDVATSAQDLVSQSLKKD